MHNIAHSAIIKRWQKGSLIFIYTMIDPRENNEVNDEAIVGV